MTPEQRRSILDVLNHARDLAIATMRDDGYPQVTTVSFVHDGLSIYFGCGRQSQKARNIRHHDKVSVALQPPYDDWRDIRGLSLAGRARIVSDRNEIHHVVSLMESRFPQIRGTLTPEDERELAVVRIEPEVISLLDYRKGFGHTEQIQS